VENHGSSRDWPGHTGNWHRWPNDRGTLNLIDKKATMRGIAAAECGHTVACARPLGYDDPMRDTPTASHEMIRAQTMDSDSLYKHQSAADAISMRIHGMVNTHIDALSHTGFNGMAFNGKKFTETVDMQGAHRCDVTDEIAIVTRGLLIDVATSRGVECLAPGDYVTPDELEAGLRVCEPGDAVIVRMGGTLSGGLGPEKNTGKNQDPHGTWPGFHPDCIDLIAKYDAAVIGSDSPNDALPSPLFETCMLPVHVLALVFYGIPLIHNMDLEALAKTCRNLDRQHFLFVVSPLHIVRATGSPCTPVAIF
jgi:kynurenine formamidase